MLKKLKGIMLSWQMLVAQALLLAVISWPFANHFVSYFWIIILVAVLIGELISKLFSPKKQTVSSNIRDESVSANPWHRVLFWIMIIVWLWFSLTLAGHFMIRLLV